MDGRRDMRTFQCSSSFRGAGCLLISTFLAIGDPPVPIESISIHGTRMPVKFETQVGQPYDIRTIDRDIHALWNTGRFADVVVREVDEAGGKSLVFEVKEAQTLRLHEMRLEPSTFGLQLEIPPGTPLSPLRAHQIALQVQQQLNQRGYANALVNYDLVSTSENQADLHLNIDPGKSMRVTAVEFTGDKIIDEKELRGTLHALRIRRIIPALPGVWGGWRWLPSYTPDAIDEDVARVRSLYLSKGYLDAEVRAGAPEVEGRDARVEIHIDAGPRFGGAPEARQLCSSLFAQRREAERRGVLDFSVKLDAEDLSLQVNRGRPYAVGRIEFHGNHRYSDALVRRNFLLDEGDVFDERRLRQSLDRLNRSQLFEPLRMNEVAIGTNEKTGVADVSIRLRERKRGSWSLSGPVGPASFAGPLEASISSRLPSWGRGIFELSTYTASISMYAFAHSILPVAAVGGVQGLFPVLALQRPFMPSEGWKSGFVLAPQLGWRLMALSYLVTQLQQRAIPALNGSAGRDAELTIVVERHGEEVPMYCEPPGPKMMWVRRPAAVALQFLGALVTL